MKLMVESEASLRSATTDTMLCFSCFLLSERKSPNISVHTNTVQKNVFVEFHLLVLILKVTYEVHHFSFAEA